MPVNNIAMHDKTQVPRGTSANLITVVWLCTMINNIGTLGQSVAKEEFWQVDLEWQCIAIDLDQLFTRQQLLHPNFSERLGKNNRILIASF
jgi:hypothetical protein